jgi:hypothetical protein
MLSRLRVALTLVFVCSLAACAGRAPVCPAGQQSIRTAQLFFGRNDLAASRIDDAEFRRFVDQELSPRFPDGLTMLDGGRQWAGAENQRIRESAKVVLIVLPGRGDARARIAAVRAAYKARYHQDPALVVSEPACASF